MVDDSSAVNLKVQGPEGLVDRVISVLKLRLDAIPTGSKRVNDRDDGVHCYLVVTKEALDTLEGS